MINKIINTQIKLSQSKKFKKCKNKTKKEEKKIQQYKIKCDSTSKIKELQI